MKKILMVCEAFGGGVFAYVSQLCNDLCDTYDIYLAYSLRPQTPKNYKNILNERVKLIEVPNFGDLKKIGKTKKFLRNIEEEIKPDIIHLHSSIAGAIGRLTFNGKNNKVIYTPHGYAHILMGKGLKSFVFKFAEWYLGKKNALTLTCCESEDIEAKKFSKNTFYIETGIDIEHFNSVFENIEQTKNDKFTVFTLGRACNQKQPALFNEIARLVPEADFIWVGNGELESKLTSPNITITGWKPREEALKIAKSADVFVLCSLGEAIAMSLIENMYIKKLCIVSNAMGNKSVINDGINGYVCNEASQYADRIKQAIIEYPTKLVNKAYEDVLNCYNTNLMKRKYIEFYDELVMRDGRAY